MVPQIRSCSSRKLSLKKNNLLYLLIHSLLSFVSLIKIMNYLKNITTTLFNPSTTTTQLDNRVFASSTTIASCKNKHNSTADTIVHSLLQQQSRRAKKNTTALVLKYVLETPELLSVQELASVEHLAKSLNNTLQHSLAYAWYCQTPLKRQALYEQEQGQRLYRVPLSCPIHIPARQRVQRMKLSYLKEVALPEARVEYVHMWNPRVQSTCDAIMYLQQNPHFLDHVRGTSPKHSVFGLLCDLAILPDARLARLLSIKRASAMTSCVARDVRTILDIKKRISALHTPIRGTMAFLSSDIPMSSNVLDPDRRPDLTHEPGFIGYASDLFIFRPEHEFLRKAVFHNLFGCFLVFENASNCQAAWKKLVQNSDVFKDVAVSFLSLDTYDDVVLYSPLRGVSSAVWTWDDQFYTHDIAHDPEHTRQNPLSAPVTSNMMTADEKRARTLNTKSTAVCQFATGKFRTSTRLTRQAATRRCNFLRQTTRRLLNVVQGGNANHPNPVPKEIIGRGIL